MYIKYKLLYVPLDLWFCDKQGNSWSKDETNLNKLGKMFSREPDFTQCKEIFYKGKKMVTKKEDWRVVEVELVRRRSYSFA